MGGEGTLFGCSGVINRPPTFFFEKATPPPSIKEEESNKSHDSYRWILRLLPLSNWCLLLKSVNKNYYYYFFKYGPNFKKIYIYIYLFQKRHLSLKCFALLTKWKVKRGGRLDMHCIHIATVPFFFIVIFELCMSMCREHSFLRQMGNLVEQLGNRWLWYPSRNRWTLLQRKIRPFFFPRREWWLVRPPDGNKSPKVSVFSCDTDRKHTHTRNTYTHTFDQGGLFPS